jgi:hypothetical protein
MMRLIPTVLAVSLAGVLAACGEREQTAGGRRGDATLWQGTDTPYKATGWQAGDKASWEQQLRQRNQVQNEYARVR